MKLVVIGKTLVQTEKMVYNPGFGYDPDKSDLFDSFIVKLCPFYERGPGMSYPASGMIGVFDSQWFEVRVSRYEFDKIKIGDYLELNEIAK